jgi:hypothetical protein
MANVYPVEWRKSRLSGLSGCVEVAFVEDGVAVRDSKDPDGPVLRFTVHEWKTFVAAVRSGQFDLPSQRSDAASRGLGRSTMVAANKQQRHPSSGFVRFPPPPST